MVQVKLPFSPDEANGLCSDPATCSLLPRLSKGLREACLANSFLHKYLHWLPLGEIGIPDYYPKLSRSLRDLE